MKLLNPIIIEFNYNNCKKKWLTKKPILTDKKILKEKSLMHLVKLMKVYCVILNVLDEEGISTIRSYPELLSKRKLELFSKKILDSDSFQGQIITGIFDNREFASYNFLTIFGTITILASITVLYKEPIIDWDKAKKRLIASVLEFKHETDSDLVIIAEKLHTLFNNLQPTIMKFETSSSFSVSVEALEKPKPEKDVFESIKEDFWREEIFEEEEEEIEDDDMEIV